MASIVVDFLRADNFYESFNKIWDSADMTGDLETSPFHIILASDCDDVYSNNVDSDGCLDIRDDELNPNGKVTVETTPVDFKIKIPLDWKVAGNNSRDVVVHADTQLEIGEPHYDVKGVFFTVNRTIDNTTKDYVIAYMILPYYLIVTNKVTFPKDTVLVSVE